MAITAIIQDPHGQPLVKQVKRSTQQLQLQLQTLYAKTRDNKMPIAESPYRLNLLQDFDVHYFFLYVYCYTFC
jgi:hypothetical protein